MKKLRTLVNDITEPKFIAVTVGNCVVKCFPLIFSIAIIEPIYFYVVFIRGRNPEHKLIGILNA